MSILIRILKEYQVAALFNVFLIQSWNRPYDLRPHNCHPLSIIETYVRQFHAFIKACRVGDVLVSR